MVILHKNIKDPSKFTSDNSRKNKYIKSHLFRFYSKYSSYLFSFKSQTSENLFLTLEPIS